MINPEKNYGRRIAHYKRTQEKQDKSLKLVSNLRLVTFLVGVGAVTFLYRIENYYLAIAAFAISFGLFINLVIVHRRMKRLKSYIDAIYSINQQSLNRIKGEWKSFEDTGEAFKNDEHRYTEDLDIFGKGSLFQWINTARTHLGREKLMGILTTTPYSVEIIEKRQAAIRELSKKLWWRQRFQAEGEMISDKTEGEEDLFAWAEERDDFYEQALIQLGTRVLPWLTVIALVLSYGFDILPNLVGIIFVLLQYGLLKLGNKKRSVTLERVYTYKNNIKRYGKMLERIEKASFQDLYLNALKERLHNDEKIGAVEQLKQLEKIADKISNRRNALFFPINILLLWDYRCMIALEKWKKTSGNRVKPWLEVIGELEALSSLAIIPYDNPKWSLPKITNEASVFRAQALGHPLLTEKRVTNDVTLEAPSRILLITGSNMSGKSTLLRTTGINLILAYAGVPVCAKSFETSLMDVYTCMRVSDNLEKNISAFYAELLRIKEIVKASREERQIIFLLDEIFKGTNSHDRHHGAKVLIKQLYNKGAMGLVSTHDLELGILEKESHGQIKNYYFQEHYKDNEIYFDYQLRPGISTTRNALYLIKMAGIDVDFEENKK